MRHALNILLRADLNRANDLEKTEAQQVLVTLYVCQHERDMKQLFAWMAKNKPIESNTHQARPIHRGPDRRSRDHRRVLPWDPKAIE